MIFIAVAVLTIWHPGYVMGTRHWNEAGFRLRGGAPKRSTDVAMEKYRQVENSAHSSSEGFVAMQTTAYQEGGIRHSPERMV